MKCAALLSLCSLLLSAPAAEASQLFSEPFSLPEHTPAPTEHLSFGLPVAAARFQSHGLWEGWHLQLTSPVLFDVTTTPTLGLQLSRYYQVGEGLKEVGLAFAAGRVKDWGNWWKWLEVPFEVLEPLSVGGGLQAYANQSFDSFFLNLSPGFSYSWPLGGGPHFFDLSLRLGLLANLSNGSMGYGPQGGLGFRLKVNQQLWCNLGLQGALFTPFEGGQSQTVIQPLAGLSWSY